jgi:hypothetical protein
MQAQQVVTSKSIDNQENCASHSLVADVTQILSGENKEIS